MNKATLLLVLAGAAGSAQAQTPVTIYGIMDAAIVGERGGKEGPVTRLTSGAAAASRIGFKGSEDLGGGLSAFYTLEMGVKIDSGRWTPPARCSTARRWSA